MERSDLDFDNEDSGVPVTSPDRNPDPLGPQHSAEPGMGGGSAQGGSDPAEVSREQRRDESGLGSDAGTPAGEEGGPAVPDLESGVQESNPAEGL